MPVSPNTDPVPQVTSVSELGPHTFQADFTEVITEQQHDDLFQFHPEGSSEIESAESVAIVEQALSSTHINEATGYTLKYSGPTCCPSLELMPKLNQFPVTHEAMGWKITGSSNDKCHCCCFLPISFNGERKWQTMTLKQNEQEILNFLYSPMVCCCRGRKDRLVDIYIPQRNKRIAILRQGNTFLDEMVLTDCVSKSVFMVKTLEFNNCEWSSSAPFTMKVLNQHGTQIATAHPTDSRSRREWTTWTDFELKFNTKVPPNLLPVSSKAVILVAFAIWSIKCREENARSMLLWSSIAIIITILLVALTILYDYYSTY